MKGGSLENEVNSEAFERVPNQTNSHHSMISTVSNLLYYKPRIHTVSTYSRYED